MNKFRLIKNILKALLSIFSIKNLGIMDKSRLYFDDKF